MTSAHLLAAVLGFAAGLFAGWIICALMSVSSEAEREADAFRALHNIGD